MKFRTRTRISFEMKTGVTSFQNDLYESEMPFRYHKYRGIIMEMEWARSRMSHYGIMWTWALLTIWSDDSRVTFLYFPLGKSDSLPLTHSNVVLSLFSFSSWIFDSWMFNCFLAVLLCTLGRGLSFLISSLSSSELWNKKIKKKWMTDPKTDTLGFGNEIKWRE